MSEKRVYLAGSKSDWRKQVTRSWRGVAETYDPFSDSRQGATYEFANDDLEAIRNSDLVFAVVDYHVFTGLAVEVGFAHALGIPVILVWGDSKLMRVDTFLVGCSAALFTDIPYAAKWTKERYLL
jgi:nucleoside 2-deoxyribosyltransferase